jgi:hypothetical protein
VETSGVGDDVGVAALALSSGVGLETGATDGLGVGVTAVLSSTAVSSPPDFGYKGIGVGSSVGVGGGGGGVIGGGGIEGI